MSERRDYAAIRMQCEHHNGLSRTIVDEFLMNYAATQENMHREITKRLVPYRHIVTELPRSWVNRIGAQYVAARVFREGGLIKKYLNHVALRRFQGEGRAFLEHQLQHPWRYSFSVVRDNPEKDFYDMEDVFSGDTFLLYSPSVSEIRAEHSVTLYLNLIANNGACWQTFGPVGAYAGFDADDIFFYATEINPLLESGQDIVRDVSKNPIPYNMLVAGAAMPRMMSEGIELVFHSAASANNVFEEEKLRAMFHVENRRQVYKLSLQEWVKPPHFAAAYYDASRREFFLSSMTAPGFEAMVGALQEAGCTVSAEADVRVGGAMLTTAEKILKREIRVDPYESLFDEPTTPEVRR